MLRHFDTLSPEELLNIGTEYAYQKEEPDNALICLTIAANKYSTDTTDEEKITYSKIFQNLWYLYFFVYFDHTNAYSNREKARELLETIGEKGKNKLSHLYLNYGCMYEALGQQTGDDDLKRKAQEYFRKSFKYAGDQNNDLDYITSFSNLIVMAFELDDMDGIKDMHTQFIKYAANSDDPLVTYALDLYDGYRALSEGNWQRALDIFKSQNKSDDKKEIRFNIMSVNNVARSYAAGGDYYKALNELELSYQLALKSDMKDAKLEVLQLMAEYGRNLDSTIGEKFYASYLNLKDSLLNYQQLKGINSLNVMKEIKNIDKEMEQMHQRSRTERFFTLFLLTIIVISVIFISVTRRNNIRLKQANVKLYENNVALMKAKELNKKAKTKKIFSRLADDKDSPEFSEHASLCCTENKRLKDSEDDALDARDAEVLNKITDVMENNDIIYQSDFSVEQLAHLINEKYKTVSRVIKKSGEDNASQLLNRYRIEEACRRINDFEKYGNLSLEAVAKDLGFKSRTTFGTAFKRFTGLTPSEYQKVAINNRKKR